MLEIECFFLSLSLCRYIYMPMSNLCFGRRHKIPIHTIHNVLIDSPVEVRYACTLHTIKTIFCVVVVWLNSISHICIIMPIEKALGYKIIIIVKEQLLRSALLFGVCLLVFLCMCVYIFAFLTLCVVELLLYYGF